MDLDPQFDRDSSSSGVMRKEEKPTRKKFAVPPVKVACLECRVSRIRCDGGNPECANCKSRSKPCVYTQSKRGGARIRKRPSEHIPAASNSELNHRALSILPQSDTESFHYGVPSSKFDYSSSFMAPPSMLAPGASLKQLDLNDPGFTFEYVFTDDIEPESETLKLSQQLVRVYSSDQNIFQAYYVFIHPYFPILPPAEGPMVDNPEMGVQRGQDLVFTSPTSNFEPTSPISLAISATLALIPHPNDMAPSETVQMRRTQAQIYAQSCFDTIEVESELLESLLDLGEALSNEGNVLFREPFHSGVPIENETVLALLILTLH